MQFEKTLLQCFKKFSLFIQVFIAKVESSFPLPQPIVQICLIARQKRLQNPGNITIEMELCII